MEIDGVKIIPGVIIDIEDPKKIGRIKCDVPTLFVSSEMNKDGMPWIYPLIMPGYQRFSSPAVGQKVWVIQNTQNYNEFWYVPMQEFTSDVKTLINGDTDDYDSIELLAYRNLGSNALYVYYLNSQGFMIKIGDTAKINITPKGEIKMQAGEAKVELRENKVYIGNGETGQAAVMGETLKDMIESLSMKLNALGSTASNSPYTTHLSGPIYDCAEALSDTNSLLCNYTNVI